MKKRIGFIGLGIMGMPMVRNLLKHSYNVTVYDINQSAVNSIAKEGANPASSGKEVALNSDVIITMLPKGEHVNEALFGQNGVLEAARQGLIIIDMSSVSPTDSTFMFDNCQKLGVHFLDAPVSGGE